MADMDESPEQLAQELSDLRQREIETSEALRQSQDQLGMALETARMGSWEWDLKTGRLTYLAGLERLLEPGGAASDRTRHDFMERVHPADRQLLEQSFDKTVADGADYDFEFRLLWGDGVRWFRAKGLVFFDRSGEAVRMIGVLMDVDSGRRVEEQLQQAQKMEAVGRLAGGIAHDFNNQLTVICGQVELLKLMMEPTDPLQTEVEIIGRAAGQATLVARQLLAFSRKEVAQPIVFDATAALDDCLKMLRNLIGEDIDIRTVSGTQSLHVKIDPVQLQQVIINLAINARDAMPRGGALTLGATMEDAVQHADLPPGAYAKITVSDTGCGMDPEALAHMFEPFFTTKGVGKGTGLGLSTVYGIVTQNDGAVVAASDPGHGTTVDVYLPIVAAPDGPVQDGAPVPESPGGSETILLVEDEDQVRQLLSRVLSLRGYRVLEADCGANALEICRSNDEEIHLLLTDIVMPGMDGRELAQHLRALRPKMKVIYVTGHAEERLGQTVEGSLLRKPFTPEAMLAQVHARLAATGQGDS